MNWIFQRSCDGEISRGNPLDWRVIQKRYGDAALDSVKLDHSDVFVWIDGGLIAI
jgi:hypothetical protein